MAKQILLSLRNEKSDESVIEMAKIVAKTFQYEIILLYVSTEGQEISSTDGKYFDRVRKNFSAEEIKTVNPILVKGDEIKEIKHITEEKDVKLIMMPAVEESDDSDELRNNNFKIIRKTELPVWEIKPGSSKNIKRILCPIDFNEHSERALKNAVALAALFKAQIMVLNVFDSSGSSSPFISEDEEDFKNEHKELLENFLKKINFDKVQWSSELKTGKPAEEILLAIDQFKADLLIMASEGRTGLSRKVQSSVTEEVTKTLPCSFIAFGDNDIIDVDSVPDIIDN